MRAKLKTMALALAGASLAGMAVPASALNIVLRPDASFTNSQNGAAALFAFRKAANYWNQTLVNDATINIAISFDNLGNPNIIGQAQSNGLTASVASVYGGLAATGITQLDAIALANRRPLTAAGGLGYRMPAPVVAPVANAPKPVHIGLDASGSKGSVYDNDDTFNNLFMAPNTANAKVLGLNFDYADTYFGVNLDAAITFNSAFAFDFDPTDGVTIGSQDFTSVALHEIGHSLGFVSGADTYDLFARPNGPCATDPDNCGFAGDTFDWDNGSVVNIPQVGPIFITPEVLSVFDLFRASTNGGASGFNLAGDGKRYLQLDPGRNVAFSIDGVNFFNQPPGGVAETPYLSTGSFNGDGNQASHWLDANGFFDINNCFIGELQIGIMDPTSGSCQQGVVTSNDLAAFDAMGYNLGFDILANRNYAFNTGSVFQLAGIAAVPEPTTWAMMIGGVGLVGGAMRRRRKVRTTVGFA